MTDTQESIFTKIAFEIYASAVATDKQLLTVEKLEQLIGEKIRAVHNKKEEEYLIHLFKKLDFKARTKLKKETKERIINLLRIN